MTGYIPTVGEYAEVILDTFATLQKAAELPANRRTAASRAAAVEFLSACLAMMRKFPSQARARFAVLMPFTKLEIELFRHGTLDDPLTIDAIALRLLGWVSQNPEVVDGRFDQRPADFLRQLAPLLDRWESRQRALAAADELVRAKPAA
jgi:hypothetical protein